MEAVTDEQKFIIAQFFLDKPTRENPRVHSKKREKRQGTLIKEMDTLIHEMEELSLNEEAELYKDAVKVLRKIKGKDAYNLFVEELISPYPK